MICPTGCGAPTAAAFPTLSELNSSAESLFESLTFEISSLLIASEISKTISVKIKKDFYEQMCPLMLDYSMPNIYLGVLHYLTMNCQLKQIEENQREQLEQVPTELHK